MADRFRIQYEGPGAEAQEIAKKELRETPQQVAESLAKLKELINAEPKLKWKLDDDFLMIFLRPCKFYPESALDLIKRISDYKVKYAEVLKDLTPETEKSTLTEHAVVNVLTDRDAKGRRVLVAHLGNHWNTKEVSGEQIFRVLYLIHLAAILEPETQVRGSVVILDFDGLGMKQVAQLTPAFSLRLLSFIQQALPLRLKEVHIVKQPFIFNIVWNVFKPLIQDKLKARLFFHGSKMESLHKHMDPDYLPEDYGGRLPKVNYTSKEWYPSLASLDGHIKEWATLGWQKQ